MQILCAWDAQSEGLFLFPLCTYGVSPSDNPTGPLAPDHIFALPMFFYVASSLYLAVENLFCHSLDHFLGYLHGCGYYLVVSLG